MLQCFFETIQCDEHIPARIIVDYCNIPESQAHMHWHREIELIYLIEGHVTLEGMGHISTLEDGGLLIFNTEEPHRAVADENNRVAKILVLHLSYEFARKYEENIDSIYFKLNPYAEAKLKPLLRDLVRFTENSEGDAYSVLEKKACVIKIYHELFAECRVEKRINFYSSVNDGNGRVRTVIEYLGEHYREDISRDDMAELVGLSPTYFSQFFKAVTKITFISYLNSLRMEHALSDLVSLDVSVMDAALSNGFANVRAFTVTCKRIFGMTPMQLKKSRMRGEM